MRHNRDAITPVSRLASIACAKMSMLIADRFVNSPCRHPCVAFVRPRAGLNVPPDTTFNYPSTYRAIVDATNIKDLARRCAARACSRFLSTSAIDPVIVDSTRQRSRTSRDSLLSCLSSLPIAPARTHRLDISSDRCYRIDSGAPRTGAPR